VHGKEVNTVLMVVKIRIREEYDIVTARVSAKEEAKKLGFGIVDQTRIATAVSELARNIVDYAGEGVIEINIVDKKGVVGGSGSGSSEGRGGDNGGDNDIERGGCLGLEIIAVDNGPGIEDIEKALEDGFSTGGGLGIGLGGVRRLMDEFEIQSNVGEGTKVRVVKWKRI